MLKQNRVLALDIGASTVKLAEFSLVRGETVRLENFHVGELGADPESEADRGRLVSTTLAQILREKKIKPGPCVVAASGQSVFTRFVKLPPVEPEKISQIVRYEAQQNVPFPIEEVVWDYQLIGDPTSEEVEVLLVAIKSDLTEELVNQAEECRFAVDIVDVGPVALYNAVRYSAGRLGESTLVMDLGARSANLLFIEGGALYARTVPIAGNAITRQISREFDLPFAEAEDLKRTQAVAPGGDDGGDEIVTRAAKAVGSVLQRLVAETSRTINFYRTQQGGTPPTRVLLTGGTAMLPNLDGFLSEKLRVPVEFLNPVVGIEIGENVDLAELSSVGHLMATVVGLGLRKLPKCALQVNLLPPRVKTRQQFLRREPYMIASAAGVILLMTAWWVAAAKEAGIYDQKVGVELRPEVERLRRLEGELDDAKRVDDDVGGRLGQVAEVADRRVEWMRIVQALTDALPQDLWITRLTPSNVPLNPAPAGGEGMPPGGEAMPSPYGMMPGAPLGMMPGAPPGMMPGEGGEGAQMSPDLVALRIEGAVYLNPLEKEQLDLLFRNRLREMTDLFVPDQTEIVEAPLPKPGDVTRSFRMVATLKEPIVP